VTIEFNLNGKPVSVRDNHPHLLAALREELDVTSPKDGCSPSGQCGCCTVHVDGKAIVSCQQSLAKTAGRSVITLEGIDQHERTAFADAFAAFGGLQCGFCIPGIVMRAKAQIDKKGADLQPADMARHLGAHLCRCTGYVKILEAIDAVAKGKQFEPVLAATVGGSGARYEASQLTLGDRDYIDDMRVPGMLHAALHLTAHARAEILSFDTTAAEAAPGVIAVFTAADIPGELRVGIIHKDWPVMIPVGGHTSYGGDVLAIIVAETRQQAATRPSSSRLAIGRWTLSPIRRLHWPTVHRSQFGAPPTTCSASASTPVAMSTPVLPARPTPCTRRSRRNASSKRSWSPRARWPYPPRSTAYAISRSTRVAKVCGTTATTSPVCSASAMTR